MKYKVISIVPAMLLMLLVLVSCAGQNIESVQTAEDHVAYNSAIQKKQNIKMETSITVAAIGDMLIHAPVYRDAKTEDGYDFTPMLHQVKQYLQAPTVTIANQETMIGGEALGLSTYPQFNSPFEVGDALKAVGVDAVTLANNHTLDRGEEAIQRAIAHWETIDMMYTGAYKDEEDQKHIRVQETEEGISLAYLSYTYGTNGIPTPAGKDYLVNRIDREKIAEDIAVAKERADAVIVSLHFGTENERMPNEEQKELAQYTADLGADVIIGHHPHVLQPVEWLTGENGKRTLVAYSLGNFLSSQQEYYQRIGGMLQFSIRKTSQVDEAQVTVEEPAFLPTFMSYTDFKDYQVLPMFDLTNKELAGASNAYEAIKAHLSQWMPELQFIEE
ncbi:Capsule biosynthesis protein CapA [Oceanobacillus picturae]|uniref:Capsule biosynthesis protein CapA n=1 Tax=Oceanobacillus picturae TaxID=171693 RepID=W9BCR0_9BACI|nr:CapA family protein [Oceanobacillus picturae]CDO04090.1 Capsule biosynthesis protein CapA [Oceanobacillus picturae]